MGSLDENDPFAAALRVSRTRNATNDESGAEPVRQSLGFPSIDSVQVASGRSSRPPRQPSGGLMYNSIKRSSAINEGIPTRQGHAKIPDEGARKERLGSKHHSMISTIIMPQDPTPRAVIERLPWDQIAVGVLIEDEDPDAFYPIKTSPPREITLQSEDASIISSIPSITNFPNSNSSIMSFATSVEPNLRSAYAPQPTPVASDTASSNPTSIMIDVCPGVSMPLRGSDETWKAIEDGRVTITICIYCQIELNCLEDAQLVICPDCTMISPVDQTADQGNSSYQRYGVGVGVKPEEVVKWVQSHI